MKPRDRARRSGSAACLFASLLALGALVPATATALPDNRAWELVSPLDKNGGQVSAPGSPTGGVLQAAAAGATTTYSSTSSFAGGGQGAPPASQYLATRTASGWLTENLSPPLVSGTYESGPFLRFSDDLSRAILTGEGNLYLREGSTETPLLTPSNSPELTIPPEDFRLSLAGASPDLGHVVISTCAKLTAEAVEVPAASGCEEAEQNLYMWSAGSLEAVNLLPGQSQSDPGAALAAPEGAVSADGQRIYWQAEDGNLYLRRGAETVQVDTAAGGGGAFAAASEDGAAAFFTVAGHLYRYHAPTEATTDLTPGGGVTAVLGASADATRLYYRDAGGLQLWREGQGATQLAPGADLSDVTPATSGVTANGARLFLTTANALTAEDLNLATDVYEWEGQGTGSCANPGGCLELISAGRTQEGASFAAASADGDDAFFLTDRSLVGSDPGGLDLYDARVGGGFPEPPLPPKPCVGDACQFLRAPPEDLTLTTLLAGLGNPPLDYRRYGKRCAKRGKCGKPGKGKAKQKRGSKRGGRR